MQDTVPADQRRGEPVGALEEARAELSLHAEAAPVHRVGRVGADLHHLVALHVEVQGATAAAVGADRAGDGEFPFAALAPARFFPERADGADADTPAAEFAGSLGEGPAHGGRDARREAAPAVVDRVVELDLRAGVHTAAAEDALVVVPHEEGIGIHQWIMVLFPAGAGEARFLDAELIGVALQAAGAALLTGDALDLMV